MSTATLSKQVTDDQLRRYATLIYDRTGIRISPQKKTLLSNRIRRRLKATGIDCYDTYLTKLRKLTAKDPEWDAFLQEITTHETYLFRDGGQWDWFRDTYLRDLQAEARTGKRPKSLRIWSAACSTGDEAYTLASCIADRLPGHAEWKIEIVGTDIGVGALEEAREAHFNERAMKQAPDSIRRRFFKKVDDGYWTPKKELTNWTTFRQHNLLHTLPGTPFDLVVLKNVLIYFDPDSKKRAFENIVRALKPGGLLVTGPAEGISDLTRVFERIHPWLHRKPIKSAAKLASL